jgi:hypothetical protein
VFCQHIIETDYTLPVSHHQLLQRHEQLQHLGVVRCAQSSDGIPSIRVSIRDTPKCWGNSPLDSLETLSTTAQTVALGDIIEDIIMAIESRVDETDRRFTCCLKLLVQLSKED